MTGRAETAGEAGHRHSSARTTSRPESPPHLWVKSCDSEQHWEAVTPSVLTTSTLKEEGERSSEIRDGCERRKNALWCEGHREGDVKEGRVSAGVWL